MSWSVRDEISILWAEHLGLTFPDDLAWLEVHGNPVVLLDARLAGCVDAYLGGRLDGYGLLEVDECSRDLSELLPGLRRGEAREYVARLIRMSDLILSEPGEAMDPV